MFKETIIGYFGKQDTYLVKSYLLTKELYTQDIYIIFINNESSIIKIK